MVLVKVKNSDLLRADKESIEKTTLNLRLTRGGMSQPGLDWGREPKKGKEFGAAEDLRIVINDV